MKLDWYDTPWQHFEVNNFLSENELQDVRQYFSTLSVPQSGNDHLRHNTIISPVCEKNAISKIISDRFIELLNQTPVKWDESKLEIWMEYDRIYPNFGWKIHNDLDTKLVSFILHISDKGTGTRLFENEDGSGDKRIVNWIPGGGGGFVRGDKTWHSFDTFEHDTMRHTVILTARLKDKVNQKPNPNVPITKVL